MLFANVEAMVRFLGEFVVSQLFASARLSKNFLGRR